MRQATLEPLLHRLLVDETPQAMDYLTVIDGTITALKPCHSESGTQITSITGRSADGLPFEHEDFDLVIGELSSFNLVSIL